MATTPKTSAVSGVYGLRRSARMADPDATPGGSPNILRGQIAGRPGTAGPGHGNANGSYTSFVGILEGETFLIPEHLYRAASTGTPGEMQLILSPDRPVCPYGHYDDRRSGEVPKFVTDRIWSLLESDGPSLQLYLRKSTHDGDAPVMMFSGILQQGEDEPLLSSERMHDLTLDLNTGKFTISLADNDHHEALLGCRGYTLSQMLKVPVWGHDADPWGLISLMEYEFTKQATELKHLTFRHMFDGLPNLSKAEEKRRCALNEDYELSSLSGENFYHRADTMFIRILEKLTTDHGLWPGLGFSGSETRSQQEARTERFQKAFNEVLTS